MIADDPPDIIIITETIPKAQQAPLTLARVSIPGYTTYLNFDPDKENLGTSGIRGISIFITDGLHASEVTFSPVFSEQLWLEFKLKDEDKLILGCIYRSPSGDQVQQIEQTSKLCQLMKEVTDTNPSHLVMVGDFNYPEIDWTNGLSSAAHPHHTHDFISTTQECLLFQHVLEPTRFRHGQSPTLLDLILSNEDGMISELSYRPGLGESDHVCLEFRIECYAPAPKEEVQKLNINRGDYDKARTLLTESDWVKDMANLEFDDAFKMFANKLEEVLTECIPKSRAKHHRKNIYMTKEAMKQKKKKYHLWKKYTETQEYIDFVRFTRQRNELRSLTRKLQQEFEKKLAQEVKGNPKAFWKYAQSRLKTKTRIDDLEREDGSRATTGVEKAEEFNTFFSSVFTQEDVEEIPTLDYEFPGSPLEDIQISPDLIMKKLKKLNCCKSPGPDGWHPRVLVELAQQLCKPLSILFRKSLDCSSLADIWKIGHVIPIHKKGSRRKAGNYRPVSLTSIVVKVLESLVRDAILDHMMEHGLFSDDQHGFVPGRSCMTQLLIVMEEWTNMLDQGLPVDAIYLDFRKAFDTVPHQRLIKKLQAYGIHGKLLRWINQFLVGRKQRVVVEGEKSEWKEVISGIPQGSVLGPLLFVLFINDMPSCVSNACKLFADDSKIYTQVRNPGNIQALQEDLAKLEDWSSKWQMGHNIDKCKSLHLGSNNRHHSYTMDGNPLSQTTVEKDLGVYIDEELKFHAHTARVVAKAFQITAVVKKSFVHLDVITLPLLYKSLIRPHLEYGNVIWGPHHKLDQKAVERVQRRVTKLIPALKDLPYEDRLRSLKIPTLYYRRRRGDMIQVYKILKGIDRIDASIFFKMASYSTRGHHLKLVKPAAKKNVRCHSFSIRIVNDWNSLPKSAVKAETVNAFKSELDRFWINEQYVLPQ